MILDFITRNKLNYIGLNFYIVKQLPVLTPERYTPELLQFIVPRVLELTYTAWDLVAFADDIWRDADTELREVIEQQWQANTKETDGGHEDETPPEWIRHSDEPDEHFPHPPFMWDDERRAHLRAELDACYSHLYGLERDELTHVLNTFPIVKRKDKEEYGEYRTKRLILEYYDEYEARFENSEGTIQ